MVYKIVLRHLIHAATLFISGFLLFYFIPLVAQALNIGSIDLERTNNQYLSTDDGVQNDLDLTNDFTFETWVKFESVSSGAAYHFLNKGRGDDNSRSYRFYVHDSGGWKLILLLSGNGVTLELESVTWIPEPDIWHHLSVTREGNVVKFYVDGVQVGSNQTTNIGILYNSHRPLKLGAAEDSAGGPENPFDGQMDDVRVWNVARTQAEIVADMNRELTGNEPGLVGYWKFNGDLEDATANNNDLTNVNGAQFSTETPFLDEDAPNPVIVIPGILGSAQKNGMWQIDPIMHTYDDLIATLDENGYTPDEDLFSFAYDWRNSNVTTAELLKQKIDAVKAICACDKVDLVAHSMGGLVARQYVQSNEYDNDVDQLIFLGTPHRGAPKAYLMWEGGEFVSPALSDGLTQRFLKGEARKNGFSTVFAYLQNRPVSSVEQLLPDYSYLTENNVLRAYPTEYPQNAFLETLNNSVSTLLNAGIDLHSFIGTVGNTITGVSVIDAPEKSPLWEHGYPENFDGNGNRGLTLGAGDATVPLPSASFIAAASTTLSSSHSALPEDASGAVVELMTGNPATTIVDTWNIPNMKMLLFQLFSPADILITDPHGRRIGMLGLTETNEIPGAFYAGPNASVEYITIPNPIEGTYTITVQGTGTGSYEVLTSYLAEGASDDLSRLGTTSPGTITNHLVSLNQGNPDELRPTVTIQSMLADLSFALEQGWLSKSVYTSLTAKLKAVPNIQSAAGRNAILESVKKEIDRRHGSGINDDAYQLLIEDITALLRQ